MELHIDIRWLLERQSEVLPKHPSVHDFSNLVAAVARHRVNTPGRRRRRQRLAGGGPDARDHPAAPLPARNALYGAALVTAYMGAAGEAVDPPYGALIDLARDIDAGRVDGYDAADRIRSWRI